MPVINLLPWRRRRLMRRIRLWSLLLTVQLAIAAFIIAGDYLASQRRHATLTQRITQLQSARQSYETQYQRVLLTTQQQAFKQAQQTLSEQGKRHNRRYQELLKYLPRLMPDALWLTEISDSERGLLLSGVSHHYQTVVDFSRRLAGHPLAAAPQLRQTRRHSKNAALLEFTLQLGEMENVRGMSPVGRREK
ncbi:PilN domain-containing protein [Lonsdalea quercina]|uniref:Pilus assembly protein HofN n=1 Tax=Lonsdalea quercina TaxID=71657 RepID=A0A1H4FCE6_9GAMM|nr:PilN domain-containing protein [Lonsdalea quercina]SEA94408.1 pilus assembly protein HofN [Lonsdalea quercina]